MTFLVIYTQMSYACHVLYPSSYYFTMPNGIKQAENKTKNLVSASFLHIPVTRFRSIIQPENNFFFFYCSQSVL